MFSHLSLLPLADSNMPATEASQSSDDADLRVMEMQLIGDLEQQLRTAELLLDGMQFVVYVMCIDQSREADHAAWNAALQDQEQKRLEESRMLYERIKAGDGKCKECEEEAHLLRVQLAEAAQREKDRKQGQGEEAEKFRQREVEWERFRERMAERERKWELERGKHRELQTVFESVVQEVQTERDALTKRLLEVERELEESEQARHLHELETKRRKAEKAERERQREDELLALGSSLEEAERREQEAARVQQKLRNHLQELEIELATERRRCSELEQQVFKEQQGRSLEVLEAQRHLNDALVKQRQLEGELATERARCEQGQHTKEELADKERALQVTSGVKLRIENRVNAS